jgi:hypothetical protein
VRESLPVPSYVGILSRETYSKLHRINIHANIGKTSVVSRRTIPPLLWSDDQPFAYGIIVQVIEFLVKHCRRLNLLWMKTIPPKPKFVSNGTGTLCRIMQPFQDLDAVIFFQAFMYGTGCKTLEVAYNRVQITVEASDEVQVVRHDYKGKQTQTFMLAAEFQAVDDRIYVPRVYQYGKPIEHRDRAEICMMLVCAVSRHHQSPVYLAGKDSRVGGCGKGFPHQQASDSLYNKPQTGSINPLPQSVVRSVGTSILFAYLA